MPALVPGLAPADANGSGVLMSAAATSRPAALSSLLGVHRACAYCCDRSRPPLLPAKHVACPQPRSAAAVAAG